MCFCDNFVIQSAGIKMSSDSSQEAAAAIDQQIQGQFGLGTWDVIAVIAYFVVILSVGLIVSSKSQNNSIFH